MSGLLRYGLMFLGGAVVGALGATAVSRGKLNVRPLAADLLSRGMEIKNTLAEKAELLRENVEDLAAEARHMADERKSAEKTVSEG